MHAGTVDEEPSYLQSFRDRMQKQPKLPAMTEALRTVMHMLATKIIKEIHLSNSTVQRRIDEMGADVENRLCNFLRTLGESMSPQNEALLLAYVQFIKEENLELLFARDLVAYTKGESIFLSIEKFLKGKVMPLTNIVAVGTNEPLSTVGCHCGFIFHQKRTVSDVLAVYCVIHRQHLLPKRLSDRLHRSLLYVITAVNKIKNNLKDKLFDQLCGENDREFNRLLPHAEVRWLSRGACLNRFYTFLTHF
ncbi:LOW QUALITY PROTEIN: hypothetical protein M514_00762 [Trichuris suis]|uniref:SCAN domain-containing protein 3 n=1 Tax=Trichuris suis TaxID=68888 RepID=A0A085N9E4_9BILA|nr:LOW QUALITY PROTEIN: hypothetical protein M513_00762 [Trichuris suis]KFD66090.1 LOW QUALITY PROTEIN: hypothetical protein M514_00762 [Trichuris suis]